jgi:hypothetical protein
MERYECVYALCAFLDACVYVYMCVCMSVCVFMDATFDIAPETKDSAASASCYK